MAGMGGCRAGGRAGVCGCSASQCIAAPPPPSPIAPSPPRTRPPQCPFCGGAGETLVGIAEACGCKLSHCGGTKIRGGRGKPCAICAGTLVVPAALVRAQADADCPVMVLLAYAKGAAWN